MPVSAGADTATECRGYSRREARCPQACPGVAFCLVSRLVATGETQAHLELKRLALIWAQANGYQIAAGEVTLPNLRFRIDVGAYKPAVRREVRRDPRLQTNRVRSAAAIGVTRDLRMQGDPDRSRA